MSACPWTQEELVAIRRNLKRDRLWQQEIYDQSLRDTEEQKEARAQVEEARWDMMMKAIEIPVRVKRQALAVGTGKRPAAGPGRGSDGSARGGSVRPKGGAANGSGTSRGDKGKAAAGAETTTTTQKRSRKDVDVDQAPVRQEEDEQMHTARCVTPAQGLGIGFATLGCCDQEVGRRTNCHGWIHSCYAGGRARAGVVRTRIAQVGDNRVAPRLLRRKNLERNARRRQERNV